MTRSPSTDSAESVILPPDAVEFYAELAQDNSREWWAAHADRYAASVREPMTRLAAALADEFGEPHLFRPHRDIRFAKDKTPYKDHQGVFVAVAPQMGWYVQVGGEGLFTAGGFYGSESDQVARYRAAVDSDRTGGQLMDIVDVLLDDGFEIDGTLLATRPRGIPADHPRLELLRHRTLTASRTHGTPEWLHTDALVEHVREDWRAMRPLLDWTKEHVGRSTTPKPPRGRS